MLHTLYPTSFLRDGQVEELVWVRHWADVGEHQRLLQEVPHAFTVFGDELVLSCSEWGVVTEDVVAIRSPMLIQSFSVDLRRRLAAGAAGAAHDVRRRGQRPAARPCSRPA